MNIIYINADTFRYDNLFDRAAVMPVRTPCLDAFAQRAVSVERMYTGSFPTIPQRTDLMTGRFGTPCHPWQDRSVSSGNYAPLLLKAHGYMSQLICDCPHLFKARFDRGFDGAVVLRGQEGDMPFLRLNHPLEAAMPREKTRSGHHFQGGTLVDMHRWTNRYWRLETDRFAPRTAETVVAWLEENYKYHPFFLNVEFFDPHEPWDPPEYMVKRYQPDYDGPAMLHPNYGRADDDSADELANLRAHYCAEAELVDRWVGRILQKIEDLQLWNNSIVVFSTDHGICLGDHNRTGKTNISDGDDRNWPLYPEIAHIPFMIAAPGLPPGKSADIIAQPADILPTLADLAGLELSPPDPFQGRSFAAWLSGEAKRGFRDIAVASQTAAWTKPGPRGVTPMLYSDEWAFAPVGSKGNPELYLLADDPACQLNVAQDNSGAVSDLTTHLHDWLRQLEAPLDVLDLWQPRDTSQPIEPARDAPGSA